MYGRDLHYGVAYGDECLCAMCYVFQLYMSVCWVVICRCLYPVTYGVCFAVHHDCVSYVEMSEDGVSVL